MKTISTSNFIYRNINLQKRNNSFNRYNPQAVNYQDTFIKNTQKHSPHFGAKFDTKPNMPVYATIPVGIFDEMQTLPDSESVTKWLVKNLPHRIDQESYKKLIDAEKILTDYDTPEILHCRKILSGNSAPFQVEQAVIQKIADDYVKEADKFPAQKHLIIVTGLPSSGKSSYIQNNGLDKDYFLGDLDIYRQELFDYYKCASGDKIQNTIVEQQFHGAARTIFQEHILPQLLDKGTNIVIPTTGIFEYLERLAKAAKDENYKITLVCLDNDLDQTIKWGLKRFDEENRFFDPLFTFKRAVEVKKIPELAKKSALFDEVIVKNTENQPYLPK